MRRITRKTDAALSQAIEHTDRRPVHRPPRDPRDMAARNCLDRQLNAFHGLSGRHHLKKRRVRVGQRTKADGTSFCEGPYMPICVVEFLDVDIGNERGLCAKSLSVQGQSERLSDRPVTAIAPNKIFPCHHLPHQQTTLYSAHFRRHLLECRAKLNMTT